MPKKLWMEAHNIISEAVTKTIPKKKWMQDSKVVAPGSFTSSWEKKRNERQERRGKILIWMQLQRIARRNKAFLNVKCKEIEENNGMCVLGHSVMSNSPTPWIVAHQAPLSMEFPRQEYWSGLPFPSLGDLPNPRIKPTSLALQASSLLTELPGKSVLVATSSFYVTGNIIPFASVLRRYYFWIHNCNFISILLSALKRFHFIVLWLPWLLLRSLLLTLQIFYMTIFLSFQTTL